MAAGCSQSVAVSTAIASMSASVSSTDAPTYDEIMEDSKQANVFQNHSTRTFSQLLWENGYVAYVTTFKNENDQLSMIQIWPGYECYETDDYCLDISNGEIWAGLSAYSDSYFGVTSDSSSDKTPTEHTDVQEENGGWAITFSYLMDTNMADVYGGYSGDTLNCKNYYDKNPYLQT